MLSRFFKKLLTPPMIILAALFMFVEEWIWDHLATFMSWVARAPFIRWLESRIAALPPYPSMAVFLLPGLMLLPVKICALWLGTHGHLVAAACVFIAAKVVGTALAARLFTLCRPSLLTVNWFRRLCEWFGRIKTRLYNSAPWQSAVLWKNSIRKRWKKFTAPWRGGRFKRRWKAIGHWLRLKFSRKRPLAGAPEPKVPDAGGPP